MRTLILYGDFGGQVYMTIPAWMALRYGPEIDALLRAFDRSEWFGDWTSYLECKEIADVGETGIDGGMGGGIAFPDKIWLHEECAEKFSADVECIFGVKPIIGSLPP